MIEAEKWKKAKEIFQTAMDLPPAQRQAFIEHEANGDALVKTEVETLLEAFDEVGDFIVAPAIAVADFVEKEQKTSIAGKQIGAYKILEEIGRGGMGAVYAAQRADAEFQKKVAVKLIKRGLDTDEIINRFRNERQILANLEHPNIARLLDGGATDDGLPFLVMEYVEGLPLTRFCDEKDLDLDARLKLFLEVCAAVQYAHRNLIVHRDLKPSNILVSEDETPKLLDFGIAKLLTPTADFATGKTATNFNVMTPEYASPEQVQGLAVTTATDVYSLGVVLYEMLTGNRPYSFENQSLENIIHTVCHSEPVRPSSVISPRFQVSNPESKESNPKSKIQNPKLLKGDLDNIVLMAMRKEPERRYSSVEQFAEDIRRYQNGLPVIAREDSFGYRAGKFVRRNKVGVAAVGGITVSLIAGIFATGRQARIARRQRDKAAKINKFLQKMLSSADPRAVGKDAKVVEVLQIAANSIEKDFDHQPEIVADLSTTIGLTFLSIGQIDSARRHLTEALEIRRSLFGLENHETAMSLNNFGKLLQARGDLRAAEKLFRQSLAILRRVRTADALDIASVLGNLGYLLMLEAKYEEAKDAHHEELRILRDRLGENHSEFARTLSNLANVFSVTGDKQTAETMHRKALAAVQKFYGGEHPDVALAMLHLAITIMMTKAEEAEDLFRQTLDQRRKFFGDGHTETAWSLFYLGDALMRKKDYEQAINCAREILSRRNDSIPETHSVINSALLLLARCYLATDRPAQAETLLRECLTLRLETLPPGHWLIATAEGYLAESLWQLKRFNEAVPLLQKSYQTLLAKLGENHEHTRQARTRLENFQRIAGIG
ncbi:MAG TPA: serine/threonine-protein kinase [Pyrinomonadaceae bacterium]|nr:serine/threonine-protein kinase [Pyrinomonadaceae bacterium]